MGVTMSPASPVAAAFSNDGALLWVVTGSANCSGGCVVHGIDVANAKEAGQQMLPEYASDIAVERASDSPVVALPGRGALVWVDKGSGSLTQTQSAQPDATLVVSNGSAVVGFAGGDTRINSDCMAPGAQQKPSAMVVLPGQPARKVDIQIPEFTGTFSTDPTAANQAIAQVTSAQVTINHAAVTPDAGRALIWATINYCGDINVSGGSGLRLCSGRVQARHEDVMLIDLASGVPISAQTTQESVMQCDLDCGILGTLTCSPVTSLPPQQFVPTGISILFGGK